jgi:hypothetical protein
MVSSSRNLSGEGTLNHLERPHHQPDAVDLVGRHLTRHRLCGADVDDVADQDDRRHRDRFLQARGSDVHHAMHAELSEELNVRSAIGVERRVVDTREDVPGGDQTAGRHHANGHHSGTSDESTSLQPCPAFRSRAAHPRAGQDPREPLPPFLGLGPVHHRAGASCRSLICRSSSYLSASDLPLRRLLGCSLAGAVSCSRRSRAEVMCVQVCRSAGCPPQLPSSPLSIS